jgi:putative tricarboxylic transport membrane protein
MKGNKPDVVRACALACAILILSLAWFEAHSATWQPDKPLEIVVPTGAGGNNDKNARLIQRILQDHKLITTPILVMNRPGGNQHLGFVYLNQRPGDAHYVIYSTPTVFSNELNGVTTQRYTDWTALALLVVENTVLTVNAASPIKSLRDLMQRLKTDPESFSFAMPARGGVPHLTLAAAVRTAGADARKLKIVVFKTNGESVTALTGGHVDVMVSSVSSVLGAVKNGNARMLALAAPQRMRGAAANVPTFREEGIESVSVTAWRGIFGPKGLNAAQTAFWDDVFGKMVETAEWKKQLEENDLTSQYLGSREFSKYLDREHAATRSVMVDLGILK